MNEFPMLHRHRDCSFSFRNPLSVISACKAQGPRTANFSLNNSGFGILQPKSVPGEKHEPKPSLRRLLPHHVTAKSRYFFGHPYGFRISTLNPKP